jgi:hypothetical protein
VSAIWQNGMICARGSRLSSCPSCACIPALSHVHMDAEEVHGLLNDMGVPPPHGNGGTPIQSSAFWRTASVWRQWATRGLNLHLYDVRALTAKLRSASEKASACPSSSIESPNLQRGTQNTGLCLKILRQRHLRSVRPALEGAKVKEAGNSEEEVGIFPFCHQHRRCERRLIRYRVADWGNLIDVAAWTRG